MKWNRLIVGFLIVSLVGILLFGCSTFGNYMGSRGLDLCDVFTLDAGAGFGVNPHLQITRFAQIGFGARMHGRWAGCFSPFWEWKRQWGLYSERSAEFAIGPLSFEYCKHEGSVTKTSYTHEKIGLNNPSEPIYDSERDFWAITVGYGGILMILPIPLAGLDIKLDFHPIEFADFFIGWFGVDISHDDLGRGWGLLGRERSIHTSSNY